MIGDRRAVVADVDFDNSYPTNGESLKASDLGLTSRIDLLVAAPDSGLIFEYDHANSKLKALYPTGGSASPATLTDPVVAVTVPSGATGVTSTAAQPDLTETLTGGRGREVADTTDLSGVTDVRVLAFGV